MPIVFALHGDSLVSAVDRKPKRDVRLRRLDNIRANGAVSVLVDDYSDDWEQLWWARADGTARIVAAEDDGAAAGLAALVARYVQYSDLPPPGPVVIVTVARWSGWAVRG